MMLFKETFVICSLVLPFILTKGLREEFTWSRISYATFSNRYNVKLGTTTLMENGGIYFPDDDFQTPQTNNNNNNNNNNDQNQNQENSNRDYIYQNNIPMGANRWKNKLFITVPRRRYGVPSSLNYVWMNSTNRHNLPLIPYPDLESNRLRSDGTLGIVSVYRVAVDVCDRLWMVDTGLIEQPGNATRVQPASILIFDLQSDRLIRRYVLKDSDVVSTSTLADITIDVKSSDCSKAYAYIPDVAGYGMIVYSYDENDSWRITHNYFYLEPLAGEMSIGGYDFQWNDGIFSIALSKVNRDGFRTAYFHSMAGVNIYSVSTRVLRNEPSATRSYHGNDFKKVGTRELGFQSSSSSIYQPNGVLFLGLVNKNALGCVKIDEITPIVDISIIKRDDMKMIYPCDVKVYENDVILLTNTMPVFLYGNLDYSQTNFRIWIENVDKAIEGTNCDTITFK